MPPASQQSDTRPAEQVLEELLTTWPPSPESRVERPDRRRPFTTAFLPPISHQAPRQPVLRLSTPLMARVDLRPMPERAEGRPQPEASTVMTPSFRDVADAIATRKDGSASLVRTAKSDEPSQPAAASPERSEDYRFAAQVVALKTAGVLDAPAACGSSPAASGYAQLYAEDAEINGAAEASTGPTDDNSVDHLSTLAAIVDLGPRLGERAYTREGGPASPFATDDDVAPLPRSIFL